MIKYSFIIATYNRLGELIELFESFEQLEKIQSLYEIIISDDGSSDGTKEFITSKTQDLPLVYLFQQNQGPGAARNNAMGKAKGEYFIFLDSDIILPPHYLKSVDQFIIANDINAFGGPDTFHPSFSTLLKAINYSMTSFLGTGGTRGSKKSIGKYYPRSFNMGIHRSIYENIGGFGGLRHGQDMDFSARIYQAGYKVGFIDDAFVYHKRRTSLRSFFNQIHNWGVARINLGRKHSELIKPIHFFPAIAVLGGLFLFAFLSFTFGIYKGMLFCGSAALLVFLFIMLDSLRKYKSVDVALLSVVTWTIQIIAYALGTMNGLWQTKILGKEEAIGISKNYYKKNSTR